MSLTVETFHYIVIAIDNINFIYAIAIAMQKYLLPTSKIAHYNYLLYGFKKLDLKYLLKFMHTGMC